MHSLGNIAFDITKAFGRDATLAQTQEFYREYNYKKYQKAIMKKLDRMIVTELAEK